MRDTRIVFVEGVLGAGQSTTLTNLVEQLVISGLRPLQPSLIYLRVHDIRRVMREICDERGAAWEARQIGWKVGSSYGGARGLSGFDGLVRLYEDFAATCEALVARAALPTLQVADE